MITRFALERQFHSCLGKLKMPIWDFDNFIMRILVVEDDEQLAGLFKTSLADQSYVVDVASNGQEAWELAEEVAYDLIILDVMLPKIDGITLCRKLRSRGKQVPIIMLTARGTSNDKVIGLDAGADDYIVKPVSLPELAARVRALLRRRQIMVSPVLKWGNLRLDPSTCAVTYGSYPLHLTPKEYALLELFLRNHQRVYSRSALLDQLWSFEDVPGEDTIKSHVKGLRQKLKAVGAGDLIETVYGLGYRLNQSYVKDVAKPSTVSQAAVKTDDQQQVCARIAKIWTIGKPKFLERVDCLAQASEQLQQDTLSEAMRTEALQEVHKLIGSLGTYGLTDGSQLARQIETLLQSPQLFALESKTNLQRSVIALRQLIEQTGLPPEAAPRSNWDMGLIGGVTDDDRPRLLIIDDDQQLADVLVTEAIAQGLQATYAPNPQTGRAMIQYDRPQVILLDLSFADTRDDGLTLLAELANEVPTLPVLVFTSSNQFTDRVAVARFKGRGFIQKPTTPTHVLETVKHVLQQEQQGEIRILAVDDDPLTLRILQTLLKPWGIQVEILADPQQFWDTLERVRPDLLVLDVQMPQISGIELCQTLRNDAQWGCLPVLFLTASHQADTIHEVFMAGADDYACKPIVVPELVTRILNRLELTRRRQSQAEIDLLTGLTNRQRSTQDLERYLQVSKHSQQPFCLAILEIDHFRHINQQHGYASGDQILRQVGQFLRYQLRREDVVSRWGGAEFVVGLYGMTRNDGVEWLAEILEMLRQRVFTATSGETHQITYTAGVTQFPEDGLTLRQLQQSALAALALAKETGGDRVLPSGWCATPAAAIVDVALVHPDPAFAAPVLQSLATRGYHYRWLQTEQAAIAALAGEQSGLRAQVVLLSGTGPHLDGLAVLRHLERKKMTRDTRVILLPDQLEDAETALKLGAFDYVMPPCKTAILMQRLRCALEKRSIHAHPETDESV